MHPVTTCWACLADNHLRDDDAIPLEQASFLDVRQVTYL